jgi:hypothetical protein
VSYSTGCHHFEVEEAAAVDIKVVGEDEETADFVEFTALRRLKTEPRHRTTTVDRMT